MDFGHSPFDGAKVLLFADIRKVLFSPFKGITQSQASI